MNELSTEVQAKETHENAVSYFRVSEQYGYKFIMEVKKIRDERYYKELGYSNFDDYCQDAWNTTRDVIDEKISIANHLGEESSGYNRRLGHRKTLLLARMPEPERNQAVNEGIPTDQGTKPVEKATQREIAEYKRRAEQAEKKAARNYDWFEGAGKTIKELTRMNEDLQNREPEVIEKEVFPDDYDKIKGGYNELKKYGDALQNQNEELRGELDRKDERLSALTQAQIKEQDRHIVDDILSDINQEVGRRMKKAQHEILKHPGDEKVQQSIRACAETLRESAKQLEDLTDVEQKKYEGEILDAEWNELA